MIFDIEKEIKYPKSMIEYKEKCFAKLKQAFDDSKLCSYMEGCAKRLSMSMDILNFEVISRKINVPDILDMTPPHVFLIKSDVVQYENKMHFEVLVKFRYSVWNEPTDVYVNKFIEQLDMLDISYTVAHTQWVGDDLNGSRNFHTHVIIDFSRRLSNEEMNKLIEEYSTMNK